MSSDAPLDFEVNYADGMLDIRGAQPYRVRITAQSMVSNLLAAVDQKSLDLLCIAAGAYALDRICKRSPTSHNQAGIRTFHVRFCVANAGFWSRQAITDQLCETLYFLTGDLWFVSFAEHCRVQTAPQQLLLGMDCARPSGVALYSGGLDSAAGLACALLDGQRDLVLLTAGHQTAIRGRAKTQIKDLAHLLPTASTTGHAAFSVNLRQAGRLREQETTQRARGFLFCASGAIVAAACGVDHIDVYENGQGAINLPVSAGGLANGLSTRGAHPAFLQMMSRLASEVFDTALRFDLPFSNLTKAQMVGRLVSTPGLVAWAGNSLSCVHTSWRQTGISHCGACPACIERHQAFEAAGVVDLTHYGERIWLKSDALADPYFAAYLWQAHRWLRKDPEIHSRLADHCAFSRITGPTSSLVELHERHAREVVRTYSAHAITPSDPRPGMLLREAA